MNKHFIQFLIGTLLTTLSLSSAPYHKETTLWEAGTLGYHHFRIPGIIMTDKGTVVAWTEARKETGDWADIDIMVRRSTDGGDTWSDPFVLVDGEDYEIEDADDVTSKGSYISGATEGVTVNNMVMIPDGDRIHMVFCLEYRKCFYAFSNDEGKTMSEPVDITHALESYRTDHDYPWKVIATGPGHGLKHSSGRLIIPAWLSTGEGGNAHRPSITGVIYSDDQGKTWQGGDIVVKDKIPYDFGDHIQSYINPNETLAEELVDGSVMFNSRTESPENRRVITVSPTGVSNFITPRFDRALWDPVCHGSIKRYSGIGDGKRSRLLFTNPNSIDAPRQFVRVNGRRENVTMRLSYDEGQTWPISRVLEPSGSGYSDITVGPDGMIYVLFEEGPGTQTQFLTLAKFNLEWLTDGLDK